MENYEKYRINWMLSHGYSLQNLMQALEDLQYEDPEDSDQISEPISTLFVQWQAEVGFGSEIWACEQEWKESEDSKHSGAPVTVHLEAYEAYKLQWMVHHDYSLTYLINLLQSMQYEDPENSDRITTPITQLYEELQTNNIGFVRCELWKNRHEWQEEQAAAEAAPIATIVSFWESMVRLLPKQPRTFDTSDNPGFWTDGNMILCPSEADCNLLCDLLRDMPLGTLNVLTGYYDPFEDDEQDDYTGFWYVDIE